MVIFGIQGYWTTHLFLQKRVLKKIQSLCVKFLWGGSSTASCHVNVSWNECCKTKQEGGLGLCDLCEWNKASIIYQVWRLLQKDTNSIWVAWVQKTLLKNCWLWTLKTPAFASWGLKKILNAREDAAVHIQFSVGNSSSFLFWHDPWMQNSTLLSRFDNGIVSVVESSSMAVVGNFIENSIWRLPPSNHTWAIELRRLVSQVPIRSRDTISWHNLQAPCVNLSTIWADVRTVGSAPRIMAVWNPLSVPRCSFTPWLAFKNRLLTKDRMVQFGMNVDDQCILCKPHIETRNHMFSECVFFDAVMQCMPCALIGNWDDYINGRITSHNVKIKKLLDFLFLAVAIHQTWRDRNERLHGDGSGCTVTEVALRIKRMVRERVFSSPLFQKKALKDNSLISCLY